MRTARGTGTTKGAGGPRRRPGSGTALAGLRPLRSVQAATAVVLGAQVPAIVTLGVLVPHGLGLLVVLPAAALSRALLSAAASPFALQPRSRAHLYFGIWPALGWWAACACYLLLAPLALLCAWLLKLQAAPCLAAVGAISAFAGVRAIWRTPAIYRIKPRFPALPPALAGYRIAQISDIHCGTFAPEERVRDWVRRVNALQPDLIAVTGDLIASGATHIAAVARALGELRAPDGVFVVMGNHDYFGAGDVLVDALTRAGLRVLRNAAVPIRRGDATLLVAGVDDTWTGRCDPEQALATRRPDTFTLLLAHDPDVFPVAARLGVALTLSGHTHGGQVGIPFFAKYVNLAQLVSRYTAGMYRQGESLLYVNRGAGTTGPPIRIGVRSEISLFTLRTA